MKKIFWIFFLLACWGFSSASHAAFDIKGYYEANKDYYGDVPLEDVAKDVFSRGGYDKKYPSYDDWKKASGVQNHIDYENLQKQDAERDQRSGENSNAILWPLITIISAIVIASVIAVFLLLDWKSWKSWVSFISAIVIASFLNLLLSGYAGVEPRKNITWTVWWIFLSIEAWKYWKWKALIPYPLYLILYWMTTLLFHILFSHIEPITFSYAYLFIMYAFNFLGLLAFYILLQKTSTTGNTTSIRIMESVPGRKLKTKLRFIGATILFFNLWLIGEYNLKGIPVFLLTFGFAAGYEYLVVRPASRQTVEA